MRIKEVCEKTGLTDKSIRVYINSGLIYPSYSENYAGRKNFSFDEKDIDKLNKIALLRKYNFSISDIKEMLENDESIVSLLEKHIDAVRDDAQTSSLLLSNLMSVSVSDITGFDEFCDLLSEQKILPAPPEEYDYKNKVKQLWHRYKRKLYFAILIAVTAIVLAIVILLAIIYFVSVLFENILI